MTFDLTNSISDRQMMLLRATTDIVTAIVSKPGVFDHGKVIDEVYAKLVENIDGPPAPKVIAQPGTHNRPLTPAEIEASITPDALISFIDGRSYKSLRRHLTANGFTPESYRAQFGLPATYPMVSANYSAARSALAKGMGLGQPKGRSRAAA